MQMIAAEDIGRQTLTYGERYTSNFNFSFILKKFTLISMFYIKKYCRKPVEQFLKTVDGLTLKDITDFTSKIISKPLTMGSFGEGNKHFSFNLYISYTFSLTE